MRILITGASGLIGTALAAALRAAGDDAIRLPRDWTAAALAGADAVVNLAGASIGEGRWRPARRRILVASRVDATARLARAIAALPQPPRVLVSASAVGYYGNRGEEELRESAPSGQGFLPALARAWEAAALAAAAPPEAEDLRVVLLRFGVVLAAGGGALPPLVRLFRLGLGGRLASGRQWMPWITLDDAVNVILAALRDPRYRGAVNAVAPQPVRNRDFTRNLAAALHRPAFCAVPAPLLRLALGRMADELLLASQRVVPARLAELGYAWRDPDLAPALARLLALPS